MRKHARGFTLVEMLVVITLLAAVWTTIAVAMHTYFQSARRVRQEFQRDQALNRLITQLRQDVHVSTRAELPGEGQPATSMTLHQDAARSVRYDVESDHVTREVQESDRLVHREAYRVGEMPRAVWHVDESAGRPLVVLQIDLKGGDSDGRSEDIKAALGLHETKVTSPMQSPPSEKEGS